MNIPIDITSTDAELVELATEGDEAAFKMLMHRHKDQVLATVLGMLGNSTEAYDVSQEVFINFYKNLKKFRGEAALSTYLTRIAVNLSLNELKRRKKKQQRFGLFGKKELRLEDTSQNPKNIDTKQQIQQALQLLDEDLRAVVVLRLIDGYSTKETADILKIPQGTVLSRLSRGRDKLKILLSRNL